MQMLSFQRVIERPRSKGNGWWEEPVAKHGGSNRRKNKVAIFFFLEDKNTPAVVVIESFFNLNTGHQQRYRKRSM